MDTMCRQQAIIAMIIATFSIVGKTVKGHRLSAS